MIRVTVAGRVTISVDGGPAAESGPGRLGSLALAYLACERRRPVGRAELADVLWGEDLPASWEQLLRGLTAKMRVTIGQAGLEPTTVLTTANGALQLHLPAKTVLDVEQAATDLAAGRDALKADDPAAARERGEAARDIAARQFLPGATGAWAERRQAELRALEVEALELIARAAIAQGEWAGAVAAAEQAVALEPFRESAYVALMTGLANAGNRGEALKAYERCRRLLADELGVRPSDATESAYVALLQEAPVVVPPAPTADLPPLPLPASLARSSQEPVAGRTAECMRLASALGRARADGRQAVFVAGEPGIGKTTLVAAFARRAHADGARILYGRCDEELGLSYQPFVEALSEFVAHAPQAELAVHVAAHGGDLTRIVPALVRRLPETPIPDSADPESDRYRLFDAVQSLLVHATRVGPVVLVLDDLHWAARPTLVLLRHLLRATTAAPILVVGTFRHSETGPDHPLTVTLADLRREAGVDRFELAALEEDDIGELVRSAAGIDDDVALTRALHAHTGGNPFFVREMLRHLGETGATFRRSGPWTFYSGADGGEVPEGVRDVVASRLRRLSADARDLLAWATVIGAEFDVDVLGRLACGGDPDRLLGAVEESLAAHLIDDQGEGRYTFAHALVRDSIYVGLTSARRARRHLAVAEAIEALPARGARRLPELVQHFAAAARAGGAARAADYAVEAAAQAFEQAAWEDAVAFLELGLRALGAEEQPDQERRCDLLLMVAETWCRFWDVPKLRAAAQEAVEVARALHSPVRLAKAARWYLTSLVGLMLAPADDMAEEALAGLGDDNLALRAMVRGRQSVLNQNVEMSEEALALARRSGDPEALGVALLHRVWALLNTERAPERLAVARELATTAPPGGWDGWRSGQEQFAVARLVMGDRSGFDAGVDATGQGGHAGRFWFFTRVADVWRATQALLDGRFADAPALIALAAPSEQEAPSRAPDVVAIQPTKLAFEQGRFRDAKGILTAALADMPGHPVLTAMLATAVAELGEAEEARGLVDVAGAARRAVTAVWAYSSEAVAIIGDGGRAAPIYERFRPFTGQVVAAGAVANCPGSVDRYLGQLAATLCQWDVAERHYQVALKVDEGLRSPPLLARSRYWYGRMLVERGQAGDADKARELLDASGEVAERLGMVALARQAAEVRQRL